MVKIGQNYHICLRSGPRWPEVPPPPYGQSDRNLIFFTPSLCDVVNVSVMMMI